MLEEACGGPEEKHFSGHCSKHRYFMLPRCLHKTSKSLHVAILKSLKLITSPDEIQACSQRSAHNEHQARWKLISRAFLSARQLTPKLEIHICFKYWSAEEKSSGFCLCWVNTVIGWAQVHWNTLPLIVIGGGGGCRGGKTKQPNPLLYGRIA